MILLKDFKNDLKQTEFGPETGILKYDFKNATKVLIVQHKR
jgi:hypothetical protein